MNVSAVIFVPATPLLTMLQGLEVFFERKRGVTEAYASQNMEVCTLLTHA